jgi:hypothetical protein
MVCQARRTILHNAFSLTGARAEVRAHFMAGHNKWSIVKRINDAIDAGRRKFFSTSASEIAVAAKLGGPYLDTAAWRRKAMAGPHEFLP